MALALALLDAEADMLDMCMEPDIEPDMGMVLFGSPRSMRLKCGSGARRDLRSPTGNSRFSHRSRPGGGALGGGYGSTDGEVGASPEDVVDVRDVDELELVAVAVGGTFSTAGTMHRKIDGPRRDTGKVDLDHACLGVDAVSDRERIVLTGKRKMSSGGADMKRAHKVRVDELNRTLAVRGVGRPPDNCGPARRRRGRSLNDDGIRRRQQYHRRTKQTETRSVAAQAHSGRLTRV